MTPLWEDFMRLGPLATLLVRFPAGDVDMSPALLAVLRLTPDARPRSLEQWCELCHPEDHGQARELNAALLRGAETALSLARRLYCGDGVYRAFRLDACIRRGGDGTPLLLMGVETALGGTSPGEPSEDSWERRMQEAARRIAEGQRRFEELLDEARAPPPAARPPPPAYAPRSLRCRPSCRCCGSPSPEGRQSRRPRRGRRGTPCRSCRRRTGRRPPGPLRPSSWQQARHSAWEQGPRP